MPRLKEVDQHLYEDGLQIGEYSLVSRVQTLHGGTVVHALSPNNDAVVIKVIDKRKITSPAEIECYYREYRCLSELLKHPHIAHCLDMLHSASRLYFIVDHAGEHTLAESLASSPGQRLEEDEVLQCFEQVASALAHCHDKDVAHRCISLEHVVMRPFKGQGIVVKIVDFSWCIVSRGGSYSRTVCGTLPCVAPEICKGEQYLPRATDCWSAGVLLLEMGGGLSSLQRSVNYRTNAIPANSAALIRHYFFQPGSHARALAKIGGITNELMVSRLEMLLVPDMRARSEMKDVLSCPGFVVCCEDKKGEAR